MKIVISSGHGKYVPGAIGILNEVTESRRVASKVAGYLRQLGNIVTEFNDDISQNQQQNLNAIVGFHNAQARNLDISVHFNAFKPTNNPVGTEVFYYDSKGLADKVSNAVAGASGLINRGGKINKSLMFLNSTKMPAILIEVCFVDSVADVNIYNSKFDAICLAIAEAVSGKKLNIPVAPSNWAAPAWEWGERNSVTDGSNPRGSITREQAVQLLYNYHNKVAPGNRA
ncbi:MAG: N-acetylmuramoyl-L-alanine amidase [Clostridiales bacterium]|jgi:N-acetylmuramoyl-L-alanine amidase|nr:N-acetylmuramoyl-L-alanine amidase [Clostridiales bacterium]